MNILSRRNVKNLISLSIQEYRFHQQTKAFKKRYKNIESSLFENKLDDKIINEYKKRWLPLGYKVEIDTFLLCYNLSGKVNYDIVPENIFAAIIEPYLNHYKEIHFLSVKNIYEKWFDKKHLFPISYFHKIDDIYYDNNFNIIEDIENFLDNEHLIYPLICKPSMGTGGGVGVKLLYSLEEVKKSLGDYKSLVFQEKILQNDLIEKMSPGINSIRTCLYRTEDGKFKVLNNSIRFGVDGSLDNETAGGIVCNINENGRLNKYAVSKYCEIFTQHPNSQSVFQEISIPFYEKLSVIAESIANEIPLCNLVSLDMCLDIDSNWRCIEINLSRQTIRFAQYAGKGFFGIHTDELISKITKKKGIK